jgi:hypothetical protein
VLYWSLLAICIAGTVYKAAKKEIYITDIAMLSGLGYFSFTTIRFVPFFIVFAIPYVSSLFQGQSGRDIKKLLAVALSIILALYFMVAQNDLSNLKNVSRFKTSKWIISSFPENAADFVTNNDLKGNMFNSFDWGGYLIWKLGPERKVFVDNRILDSGVVFDALAINSAKSDPPLLGKPYHKTLLDGYNINYVITKLYNSRLRMLPLVASLINDPEWIPVYEGSNAIIFVKDKPSNSTVIKKFSHVQERIIESQINQINAMIKRSPGHVSLYLVKGDLYLLTDDVKGAMNSYREALKNFPDNEAARGKLENLENKMSP